MSTGLEGRAEALFEKYAYPAWLRRHSLLVGRVASVLADWAGSGLGADREPAVLAAYLHDIGKSPLLARDPRQHNELSALVLSAEGLGSCAEPARRHAVYAVLHRALEPRTLAERIVYYADRRAGLEVLPLDERIAGTARRHPEHAAEIERARPLAEGLEAELFVSLGRRPDDLAREVAARWP